jgi:hypothetical protein
MMISVTPEDRLAQIRRDRADYDRARERLFRHIAEALAEGAELPEDRKRELGPSAIGRAASFTREYISKIRDGRHEDAPATSDGP